MGKNTLLDILQTQCLGSRYLKLDCSQVMGASPRDIGATYALDYTEDSNTEIKVTLFMQAAS